MHLRWSIEKIQHARAAGLGPWTQLADQGRRLQILAALGQHQDVLDQLPTLLKRMENLPDQVGDDESVRPSNIREGLFDAGRSSANATQRWQEALDYNARALASMQRRGATAHHLAYTRFNDAGPLIDLGRYEDAEQVLRYCQQAYEDVGDTASLGKVFTLRARIEGERGHRSDAVRLQRQALRLDYVYPDPSTVAISHHNLAYDLDNPAEQRAHRLAAALLFTLIGDTHYAQIVVRKLARELRNGGTTDGMTVEPSAAAQRMPTTLAEVAALVDATEGVHYASLVTALTNLAVADQTLTQIIHSAWNLDHDQQGVAGIEWHIARWQPIIDAVTTAATSSGPVPSELTELLDQVAASEDWRELVGAIRRVLAGDGNRDALLTGLDPIDTAILTAILDRLPT